MRIPVFLAALFLLTGCGDPAAPEAPRDLAGDWSLDVERTLAEIDTWPITAEEKASAKEFFGGEAMAAVRMQFASDGTCTSLNRPGVDGPVKGDWKVASKDGDAWVLDMRDEGKPFERSTVHWIDANHIKVVEEGTKDTIVLKRE